MNTKHGFEVTLQSPDKYGEQYLVLNIKKGIYSSVITLSKYPSGNCQVSMIGYMYSLLPIVSLRKEVQEVVRACYELGGYEPHLIMMDVHKLYIPNVEKAFEVVHKHEYVSTNWSKMCLFMVKLDNV